MVEIIYPVARSPFYKKIEFIHNLQKRSYKNKKR